MLHLIRPTYNKLESTNLGWATILAQNFCTLLLLIWLKTCYRMRIRGKANLSKENHSMVTISNHTSMLDVPIMAVVIWPHPIGFMAKKELFEHPIAARYFYWMGTFAVNREKLELASIKSALTLLKTNRWTLGLFPEGTRVVSDTGEVVVGKAKRGTAYLAHAAKVPVQPMGIVRVGPAKKDIFVCVGPLIPYHEDLAEMTSTVEAALKVLTDEARQWAESELGSV